VDVFRNKRVGVASMNMRSYPHPPLTEDTSIIQLVDDLLNHSIERRASDLHFEPEEDCFRIRYRIDGALEELKSLGTVLALPIISRLKVMADLNISEQRLPQDGRIKIRFDQRLVDLRVSTLPTQSGESVVIRILDQTHVQLELSALGLPDSILDRIRRAVRQPNGILLVTGPTGSGKTTTLYSALNEVNDPEIKILTVEDPVEYEIEGLIQTAVNPEIGLDFSTALRAFLRQDPDKILIGEIRDLETAQIAVQASLTGHLILSTLHTNDAAGAVTRMVDMGLEPYLLASALKVVLAQRLLRAVCSHCREWEPINERDGRLLGLNEFGVKIEKTAKGRGCDQCNQSGYAGRIALFELLEVNPEMCEMIVSQAAVVEIKSEAICNGMKPLRLCGLDALAVGQTTISEVLKYT